MKSFDAYFEERLNHRRQNGLLRVLPSFGSGIDFLSNDYLGWAERRLLDYYVQNPANPIEASMSGSTGSRLLSGNSVFAEDLEHQIAAEHHAEAALLFNSGYAANLGVLQALGDRHTTFILDELCHASLLDGARLAISRRVFKFSHNNMDALRERLALAKGKMIVVVESVYSMDGDEAPLDEIAALCREFNAGLIVDEAHALGVMGKHRKGVADAPSIQDVLVARIYTYGKAFACHGAAVVGSGSLRSFLVNFSRPLIYSTAAPLHQWLAIEGAYKLLKQDTSSHEALQLTIQLFHRLIRQYDFQGFIPSRSAIQSLKLGSVDRAFLAAEKLNRAGIVTKAIVSPTVAAGSERIRFCLHATHTTEQIHYLFETLHHEVF